MFLFGIGTPVRRSTKLFGISDRLMDEKSKEIDEALQQGKRPHGTLPEEMATGDEFMDKIVRSLMINRAKMQRGRGVVVE